MFSERDTGARCTEHVGEIFPPRCYDCEAEAIEEHNNPNEKE